ncbi:MAG: SDR family NAD(P)-dependent oxidoreductase [Promethearchaeota archaeon]
MIDFKDKVAVITGAASGIGRGIAEKCAKEGMRIVVSDIEEKSLSQTEKDIKSTGVEVLSIVADVSKIDEVENLAQKVLARFKEVHLLVNNAGVGFATKTSTNIWEYPISDWNWILNVNVWGVIHGIYVFIPIMLKQNNECYLVNTASMAGLITPVLGVGIYSITKHTVVAISESLKHELQRIGSKIKVFALCPGFVKTNLTESERNRPEELRHNLKANPEFDPIIKVYQQAIENGITPQEVADKLFQGIKKNKFYIPTDHLIFLRNNVTIRMEGILRDLKKD